MIPSHPLRTPSAKRHALAVIRRAHPGIACIAQCDRLKAALAQFSVTTFEAMRFLDVYDPRARVMQLRNDGVAIDTQWRIVETESGDKHRIGLYVMRSKT